MSPYMSDCPRFQLTHLTGIRQWDSIKVGGVRLVEGVQSLILVKFFNIGPAIEFFVIKQLSDFGLSAADLTVWVFV